MMRQTLKAEGAFVNRKRVQRLLRLMGLESTAPKPNTSKPAPEHAVYPYLLRNVTVSRVNQVWAADISVPQQAAREMGVGPPESPCRRRFQTTVSGCGQKPWS